VAIVIEPLQNGPYLVKNLESLTNSKGAVLPTKNVLALCRCGHSTTKPFCSGMHKEIGFDSSRLGGGPPDRRDGYAGDGITIHDNRGSCAHIGRCTDDLAAVFRLGEETAPWGEGASREHYALCRCGQSRNKPFCDGSHWDADFRDEAN
jgi:CDGSH-type Zn-finger protein